MAYANGVPRTQTCMMSYFIMPQDSNQAIPFSACVCSSKDEVCTAVHCLCGCSALMLALCWCSASGHMDQAAVRTEASNQSAEERTRSSAAAADQPD